MGATPDELYKPLGQDRAAATPSRLRISGLALLTAFVLTLGVGGTAISYLGDPMGGRPYAVAKIERITPAPAPQPQPRMDEAVGSIAARANAGVQTAADAEAASGVRVTRGDGEAPGVLIIKVPQAEGGVALTPAPDRRLVERSRFGQLPRIGADGARPFDIYARPKVSSGKLRGNVAKIALVVGGLGLSETTTRAAIEKMPPDVSLAFAPYGADVAALAAEARDRGHEILLQAPMEPFDYPRNDPGPHTLTVQSAAGENTSGDLHWLLSRFPGFVGVANFMGGRFLGDEAAVTPFMRELAARGLGYFDDGSAPQSLGPTVAARAGAPSARADIYLDSDPRPEALEAALTKLEAKARLKGAAIGFVSATPAALERVSRFARSLEARGVALTPISTLMNKGEEANVAATQGESK
jgi:hypothetical protein